MPDFTQIKSPPIMMKSNKSSLILLHPLNETSLKKKRKQIESQIDLTMEEDYQIRNNDYMKMTCLGSKKNQLQDNQLIPVVKKHVKSSGNLDQILPMSNDPSNLHSHPQQDSLDQNGTILYEELLLTLTTSTHPSTTFHLLRRTLDMWDQLKSVWDTLNLQGESKPMEIGSQHTMRSSKLPRLSSHTENKNSTTMVNTSTESFHQKWSRPIEGSSSMMPPSEMKWAGDNKFYLPKETSSLSFILQSSCLMESNPIPVENNNPPFPMEANLKIASVKDSTPQMDVPMVLNVDTNTSVATARDLAITKSIVTAKTERIQGLQPKYLRYNLWSLDSNTQSTADWTEFAYPLLSIPSHELQNPIVIETITHNPSFFKIVTPIDVDRFESLLHSHPNQLFVQSVCKGLCEGFWPWADTLKPGYPTTHDASLPTPKEHLDATFLHSQKDIEVQKE